MPLQKPECTCSPCPNNKVCTNVSDKCSSTEESSSPTKRKQTCGNSKLPLQMILTHMKESLLRRKEKMKTFYQNAIQNCREQHKNQSGLKANTDEESSKKSKTPVSKPPILKRKKSKDGETQTDTPSRHITVMEPSASSKNVKSKAVKSRSKVRPTSSQQSVESGALKQLYKEPFQSAPSLKDQNFDDVAKRKKIVKDQKKAQAEKEKKEAEKMEQDRKAEEERRKQLDDDARKKKIEEDKKFQTEEERQKQAQSNKKEQERIAEEEQRRRRRRKQKARTGSLEDQPKAHLGVYTRKQHHQVTSEHSLSSHR